MLQMLFRCYFIVFLLFTVILCEKANVKSLLEFYENNLKASLDLDRNDKLLKAVWSEDFQVKQVNVTTKYRLQMTEHKNHNFKKNYYNSKWRYCLEIQETAVTKSEQFYYDSETSCLKVANSADDYKIAAVNQIEKEIRKWRKGYKYLQKICKIDNLNDDEGAGNCLVEYMQKDNYDQALQRLMILKLESMSELFRVLTFSILDLEECLKQTLSRYLEKVRSVMDDLNKCYQGGKH